MPDTPPAIIHSPCVNICRIDDANGYCKGCFRTRGEIEQWMFYNNDEKAACWERLHRRRKALESP